MDEKRKIALKRKISLHRAEELRKATDEYQQFKKSYPLATDEVTEARVQKNKEKILAYFNADEKNWNDWKWQVSNRISDVNILADFFGLSKENEAVINEISSTYRWACTPYYLSLMEWDNPEYPINKMAIPSAAELDARGEEDPMDEEHTNPAACITRRYPNRLIINVTSSCAMFCRHCQRRRLIGECDETRTKSELFEAIEYVKSNPEIRDVLVTGGDPLMLKDDLLEFVLSELRKIPHVEILRVGTRVPVTMPQRITPKLVKMLKKYHPLFINIQFNHPRELTKDAVKACTMLSDAGIPLGNQMVFLKGINNDKLIVQMLNEELLKARVRPYYIFHPKQVIGTEHFGITVEEGLKVMEHLRGHTSGLAIPTYILNAPGGLGKIPLLPEYILESDSKHVRLRTWEGREVNIEY